MGLESKLAVVLELPELYRDSNGVRFEEELREWSEDENPDVREAAGGFEV